MYNFSIVPVACHRSPRIRASSDAPKASDWANLHRNPGVLVSSDAPKASDWAYLHRNPSVLASPDALTNK